MLRLSIRTSTLVSLYVAAEFGGEENAAENILGWLPDQWDRMVRPRSR
jgi:hypothetical protein